MIEGKPIQRIHLIFNGALFENICFPKNENIFFNFAVFLPFCQLGKESHEGLVPYAQITLFRLGFLTFFDLFCYVFFPENGH